MSCVCRFVSLAFWGLLLSSPFCHIMSLAIVLVLGLVLAPLVHSQTNATATPASVVVVNATATSAAAVSNGTMGWVKTTVMPPTTTVPANNNGSWWIPTEVIPRCSDKKEVQDWMSCAQGMVIVLVIFAVVFAIVMVAIVWLVMHMCMKKKKAAAAAASARETTAYYNNRGYDKESDDEVVFSRRGV